MSTRFTQKNIPMVESKTLQLVISTSTLNETLVKYLSRHLMDKGYHAITPSLLQFLSALECGVNYGSEIARNLEVTRQMVAKTVKQLCQLGYLEQLDDVGKQKKIVFTTTGEHLMSDARQALANLDAVLARQLKSIDITKTINDLENITTLVKQKMS